MPEEFLLWEHRLPLIVQHMLQFECDVICAEEVDHPEETLEKLIESSGRPFQMVYQKKKSEENKDGCAIFYDTSKMTLEESQAYFYHYPDKEPNRMLLSALFKTGAFSESHSVPEVRFMVSATHLKAGNFEELRI